MKLSNAIRISVAGEKTNPIIVGIGIREVIIPADGNNITIPLQTIIKQTKVQQIKVLQRKSGSPKEKIEASKTRKTKTWGHIFF